MGEDDVFVTGWSAVSPIKPPIIPAWIEYIVDHGKNVEKWEAVEIGRGWEISAVAPANISKNVRRWVHDREA